jgi:hypothetical protein
MMKNLAFALTILAAACGNKQPTPVANAGSGGSTTDVGPMKDTRTEIERRRDAACETLGPRMTACAVADAKRDLAAGKIKQDQFDKDTAPEIQKKNTEEFFEKCHGSQFSSRQVRVLEVCQQQETECEPLLACLDNLNRQ